MPSLTKYRGMRAKNYNYAEAVQQAQQIAPAAAEDWFNSNFVEAYDALYWQSAQEAGNLCTCQATIAPLGTVSDDWVVNHGSDTSHTTTFKISEAPESMNISPNDGMWDRQDIKDLALDSGPALTGESNFLDNFMTDGIDCGICYRLGVQPAYQLIDGVRYVLTSLNVDLTQAQHATILQDQQPHQFEILQPDNDQALGGYVRWSIIVPKYFDRVRCVVFNNVHQLNSSLFYLSGGALIPLTVAALTAVAGRSIDIYVKDTQFTHVIFEFDIGVPKGQQFKISLPQLQRMRDYSKFITIPTSQIVIDNRVGRCFVHDLIFSPALNIMWKVTEMQPLYLTKGLGSTTSLNMAQSSYPVGWQLQGRIVQPEEAHLEMPIRTKLA